MTWKRAMACRRALSKLMHDRAGASWVTHWTAGDEGDEDEDGGDASAHAAHARVCALAVDGPLIASQCDDGAVALHDFRWGRPIGGGDAGVTERARLEPSGRRFWQCVPYPLSFVAHECARCQLAWPRPASLRSLQRCC